MVTAKDIMTKGVVTVSPSTTVDELSSLLAKNRISGVPVVDKKKRVVGIATEADILAKPGTKTVEEIMTKKVITVTPDTPVEEIAKILARKKIKRVPVVTEGKLVGIVSQADIVLQFAGMLKDLSHEKKAAFDEALRWDIAFERAVQS